MKWGKGEVAFGWVFRQINFYMAENLCHLNLNKINKTGSEPFFLAFHDLIYQASFHLLSITSFLIRATGMLKGNLRNTT